MVDSVVRTESRRRFRDTVRQFASYYQRSSTRVVAIDGKVNAGKKFTMRYELKLVVPDSTSGKTSYDVRNMTA